MSDIDELQRYTNRRGGASPLSLFRQLVANGGIKFNFGLVSLELKEHDLGRIHDIIHEIDDRRAFYNALDDETPEHMVASVKSAKSQIHELRKGLWVNAWAREAIQLLLHDIGEFLTQVERGPLPRNHHARGFEQFEQHALELRLRVWTTVAHFVAAFGDQVNPLHLPLAIREEVTQAYQATRG